MIYMRFNSELLMRCQGVRKTNALLTLAQFCVISLKRRIESKCLCLSPINLPFRVNSSGNSLGKTRPDLAFKHGTLQQVDGLDIARLATNVMFLDEDFASHMLTVCC